MGSHRNWPAAWHTPCVRACHDTMMVLLVGQQQCGEYCGGEHPSYTGSVFLPASLYRRIDVNADSTLTPHLPCHAALGREQGERACCDVQCARAAPCQGKKNKSRFGRDMLPEGLPVTLPSLSCSKQQPGRIVHNSRDLYVLLLFPCLTSSLVSNCCVCVCVMSATSQFALPHALTHAPPHLTSTPPLPAAVRPLRERLHL